MELRYDPQVDALYLRISEEKVMDTREIEEGVMIDYDAAGAVVGVEILDASEHLQVLSKEKAGAFLDGTKVPEPKQILAERADQAPIAVRADAKGHQ
jgi:uncharacterized protein YuzE